MLDRIRRSKYFPTLWQFIKFGVIGASNTAVSFGVEMLGMYVLLAGSDWSETVRVTLVSAMSFVVSTIHSYYWNNRFVFRSEKGIGFLAHARRYYYMARCYALTGLILSPLMKRGLLALGAPFWAASPIILIVTVPLNFILNKFWAFRDPKRTGEKSGERRAESEE